MREVAGVFDAARPDVGAAAQVADLLGVRLGEDEDRLTVPPEPDRDEVRPAVGPDHRQPYDRLVFEEPADARTGDRPTGGSRGLRVGGERDRVHDRSMVRGPDEGHGPPSR